MCDDVQIWWNRQYKEILWRCRGSKVTNIIWRELAKRYEVLNLHERQAVGLEIIKWFSSDDLGTRSDALYLVQEYDIQCAVPAMTALEKQLIATIENPSTSRHDRAIARSEQEKIQRIFRELKASANKS